MTSTDSLAFRSRLWLALGLAPALACGGKVVFVEDGDGAGGEGASSQGGGGFGTVVSSSSSSTGMAGAGPFCASPEGLTYVCFQAFEFCPEAGSEEASGAIEATIEVDQSCTAEPGLCWCEADVHSVPCGPDPDAFECCYYADVSVTEFCEGRPFIVRGRAVLAPLEERTDWQGTEVQVACANLTGAQRAELGQAWAESGGHEHASVASFARFTLELLSLGAPPDLVRASQSAMGDEIAHAELCFALASALLARPIGPGPLAMRGALNERGDAAAIVAATVREGCIGETISALGAVRARDLATDPAAREALDRIAKDELAHAELAWRFVAWAIRQDLPGVRAAVAQAFAQEPAPPKAAPSGGLDHELAHAFGLLTSADEVALARDAWRSVIAPTASAMLATPPERLRSASARAAWPTI